MEKWEFKKITLPMMMEYIEKNAPADKAWFKSVAFDMRKTKKAIDKVDGNGNPIYKQAKDKNGNYKFNADGTPKMIKAREYIEVEDSTAKPVFNLLKAKRAFCAKYMADILPKETPKTKASDDLLNW